MAIHLITAALSDEVSTLARYIAGANLEKGQGQSSFDGPLINKNGVPKDDRPHLSNEVRLLITGVGSENARAKIKKAIAEFRPDSITSMGFSGLTTDEMEPGTLFLPEEVVSLTGPPTEWALDKLLPPIKVDKGLHDKAVQVAKSQGKLPALGRLITLPIIARTANLKQWLGKRFGASQADMETYTIALLAKEADIPFLSVRVGLDKACFEMPEILPRLGDANVGNWDRLLTIAEYVTKRPADITKFVTLGIGSHKARQTLTTFSREYFACLTAPGRFDSPTSEITNRKTGTAQVQA